MHPIIVGSTKHACRNVLETLFTTTIATLYRGKSEHLRSFLRVRAQLDDNLGATGWKLTKDELKSLDEASALPDASPYHFIASFANDR